MPDQPKHDLDTVLDAVRGTGKWYKRGDMDGMIEANSSMGNISVIAHRLGVSRTTIYTYMKKWKTVETAIREEEEVALDFSEYKLLKNIAKGKEASNIFHLKTKGKKRGWVERQELAGPSGEPIHFNITQGEAADVSEFDDVIPKEDA